MDEEVRTEGRFTFAYVDTPSDCWLWSIVTDYKDAQDYEEVICSFDEMPNPKVVGLFLKALHFDQQN